MVPLNKMVTLGCSVTQGSFKSLHLQCHLECVREGPTVAMDHPASGGPALHGAAIKWWRFTVLIVRSWLMRFGSFWTFWTFRFTPFRNPTVLNRFVQWPWNKSFSIRRRSIISFNQISSASTAASNQLRSIGPLPCGCSAARLHPLAVNLGCEESPGNFAGAIGTL